MLKGLIIKGDGVGKLQGYPTANIDIPADKVHLNDGVYAAWAYVHNIKYPAALLVMHEQKRVEVHLLDYEGADIYGLYLEVDPVQKISEIEKLPALALQEKIINDISLIKEILQ